MDSLNRQYQFNILPPLPDGGWPTDPNNNPTGRSFVKNCNKNKNPQVVGWCNGIWVYQEKLGDARGTIAYHVQIGAPPAPQ